MERRLEIRKKVWIDEKFLELLKEEVFSSFDEEELSNLQRFEDFWVEVDIKNSYEEEWKKWKRKGIEKAYRVIWERFIIDKY